MFLWSMCYRDGMLSTEKILVPKIVSFYAQRKDSDDPRPNVICLHPGTVFLLANRVKTKIVLYL